MQYFAVVVVPHVCNADYPVLYWTLILSIRLAYTAEVQEVAGNGSHIA